MNAEFLKLFRFYASDKEEFGHGLGTAEIVIGIAEIDLVNEPVAIIANGRKPVFILRIMLIPSGFGHFCLAEVNDTGREQP